MNWLLNLIRKFFSFFMKKEMVFANNSLPVIPTITKTKNQIRRKNTKLYDLLVVNGEVMVRRVGGVKIHRIWEDDSYKRVAKAK